jgi:hypothetical protein
MYTKCWSINLNRKYHLEDISIGGRITVEWTIKVFVRRVWDGLFWLRVGTSGGGALVNTVMNRQVL